MTGWLEGKRALVVGAGSGIGRAILDAFRAEGAKVAALERVPEAARAAARRTGDRGRRDRLRRQRTGRHRRGGRLRWAGHAGQLCRNLRLLQGHRRHRPARPARRVRRDVSHQRAQPYAVGQGGDPGAAARGRGLDRADRVRLVVLPGTRRRALRRLEIRGARPGFGAGPRVGAGDPGQRGGARRHAEHRSARPRQPGAGRHPARRQTRPGPRGGGPHSLHVALTGEDHAFSYVFLASDRSRGITGETVRPDGGFGLGATKPDPKGTEP